ncbi:MAG: HIT domain-containing protein [Nanoarchaeota archaeon]|nr:HIT domain-containing protein [Nanoarchaeota archaeon]
MAEPPFTPEQIQTFNKLAKLPPEKQKLELQTFLATLNEEQIAYLKSQQQGEQQCIFCSIAEGKISSAIIYQDVETLATLDIRPATKGHVLLFPKKHYALLSAVPDELVGKLFVIANKIGKQVYEKLKPLGTNIHVAQGEAAGQVVPHVLIHIIPRYKDDKVSMEWEGTKTTEQELQTVQQELSGIPVLEEKKIIKQEPPKEIAREKDPTNDEWVYAYEQRIP